MDAIYHKKIYDRHKRKSIIEAQKYIRKITYELSWISDHFVKALNDIFITKQEYQKIFPDVFSNITPRFVMITSGHGSPYISIEEKIKELQEHTGPKVTEKIDRLTKLYEKGKRGYTGGQISGFNSKDFGTFVKFCENNLVIKLLFLNTCYGAEVNIHEALIDIAEDITDELPKLSFSFPIISGAFSTALSYGSIHVPINIKAKKYKIETETKTIIQSISRSLKVPLFQKFFNELNTSSAPNHTIFIDALKYIYFLYLTSGHYNNIPMIKEGNQPWQPLLTPGTYLTIDQNEVAKQKGSPLNVATTVDLIFPDVFTTPFPLIINSSKMPAFISKTAGNMGHEFIEMKAPNIKFSDFIKAFFTIPDLADTKAFFIQELELLGKENKPTTLNNVLLLNNARKGSSPQQIVFFESNGKKFYIDDAQNMKSITESAIEPNTKQINEIKNILNQLPQVINIEPKPTDPKALDELAGALHNLSHRG